MLRDIITFFRYLLSLCHIQRYLGFEKYIQSNQDVLRYPERFKISWFDFRYLKMAKDIFWSRVPTSTGGSVLLRGSWCCGWCFLHLPPPLTRSGPAQTDVSNAFRVYYWTERSSSHSHGASWRVSQAQSSGQRSSCDAALGWAVAGPNEAFPFSCLQPLETSAATRPAPEFLRSCCPSRALYTASRSQ